MNVKIGTEAAQFPEKQYINGIFVAVCYLFYSYLLWSIYNGYHASENPSEFRFFLLQ